MIDLAFEIIRENPLPGVLCEFGVYRGDGLECIRRCRDNLRIGNCPVCLRMCRVRVRDKVYCNGCGRESIMLTSEDTPIYGFDSFEGMPETSVTLADNHKIVWRPGGFSDTSVEAVRARVPEARIIKAVFSDLRPLIEYGIERVRFARIDCDIYEGYRDALRLLTPCIAVGTVLLFDEGVAPDDPRYHDSIQDSGERAISEWQEESGWRLKIIESKWTELLTVVEGKS